MMKFLKESDIYGYPITLNFQESTLYKSPLGGSLSLITMITIIVFAYSGAVSLVRRETALVNSLIISKVSE